MKFGYCGVFYCVGKKWFLIFEFFVVNLVNVVFNKLVEYGNIFVELFGMYYLLCFVYEVEYLLSKQGLW